MAVRLLKDPDFQSWAADEDVTDDMLRKAAMEIEAGLVDARLGGFLLKKRVAAPGRGKSGSYRTIVAHRPARVRQEREGQHHGQGAESAQQDWRRVHGARREDRD